MIELNVFVTGTSSGIGRASAIELAARGHHVFAGARRPAPLHELAEAHRGIVPTPLDVTDPASVLAAAASIDDATGGHGSDVLVNAAGYALGGPVEAEVGDRPNAWEGGRMSGRVAVRDYWIRQRAAIDPKVTPPALATLPEGRVDVLVHQIARMDVRS
jgi:NAD(P)-dependent dehydrogenase (short-subunit alcohol dehydrogenase family)